MNGWDEYIQFSLNLLLLLNNVFFSLRFWCDICECLCKDSQAYLDHINGRNHNRILGILNNNNNNNKRNLMIRNVYSILIGSVYPLHAVMPFDSQACYNDFSIISYIYIYLYLLSFLSILFVYHSVCSLVVPGCLPVIPFYIYACLYLSIYLSIYLSLCLYSNIYI